MEVDAKNVFLESLPEHRALKTTEIAGDLIGAAHRDRPKAIAHDHRDRPTAVDGRAFDGRIFIALLEDAAVAVIP